MWLTWQGCGGSTEADPEELKAEATEALIPQGHDMLVRLIKALEDDKKGVMEDPIGKYVENVKGTRLDLKALEEAGTDVDAYTEWVGTVKEALKSEATTIFKLKYVWKVGEDVRWSSCSMKPAPAQSSPPPAR